MIKEDELVEIGKFRKTHGLDGEINATVDVDDEFFDEDFPLIVDRDGIYVPFYVEEMRPKGAKGVLLKLEGVDSQEAAASFVNSPIFVRRDQLADFFGLDPDDPMMMGHALEGYTLVDSSKGEIGRVSHVDDSTANVLLEVETDDGRTLLVPLVDDLIEEVDQPGRRIVMNLPDGLIDL